MLHMQHHVLRLSACVLAFFKVCSCIALTTSGELKVIPWSMHTFSFFGCITSKYLLLSVDASHCFSAACNPCQSQTGATLLGACKELFVIGACRWFGEAVSFCSLLLLDRKGVLEQM